MTLNVRALSQVCPLGPHPCLGSQPAINLATTGSGSRPPVKSALSSHPRLPPIPSLAGSPSPRLAFGGPPGGSPRGAPRPPSGSPRPRLRELRARPALSGLRGSVRRRDAGAARGRSGLATRRFRSASRGPRRLAPPAHEIADPGRAGAASGGGSSSRGASSPPRRRCLLPGPPRSASWPRRGAVFGGSATWAVVSSRWRSCSPSPATSAGSPPWRGRQPVSSMVRRWPSPRPSPWSARRSSGW